MRRLFTGAVLVCISLIGSCTTTGDPTQGGLWGWSESKSIQRVENLRAQESEAQARYDSIVYVHDSKQAKLNKAKSQAKAAQQRAINAQNKLNIQRNQLNATPVGNKVDSLERDVKLLEVR